MSNVTHPRSASLLSISAIMPNVLPLFRRLTGTGRTLFLILVMPLPIAVGCGGGAGGGSTPPLPTTYTIGGAVSGLTGTGLVLQDNSGNNLTVSANGAFTFSNSVASGSAYYVTMLAQPTGQFCTVTNGSGTASGNVTNVQVVCSNITYTVGGTVSGLDGGIGLVLQDNGGNNLTVSANGAFTFSNSVASGATYSVTLPTQPTGQICTVTNGSGTASANVTNVQVVCSDVYTIGGTVSGLTGTGLVLQDNGGNNLAVSANGSFTFSNSVASGAAYSVTVLTQPTGQSCTVSNGSGTASATAHANVTNVQVACSNKTYTIGGTVSGLTGTGLVLQDNSGNNLAVSASGSFAFSTAVASGAAYSVTVLTQPTGQSCAVTSGSGTASANVTNVQVACSTAYYTIDGTVSGLTGTGLVLQDNSGNNLGVALNGSFSFTSAIAKGAAYSVTVLTQPTGQSCTVINGSGTASANVTNVQVVCSTAIYTIGGTVSGLTGTGLVLQNSGGNNLSVSANGAFTFSSSVYSSSTYSVTVLTQPTGQTCTVSSGSGTVTTNVTNVQVACSTAYYTIGGTVSGLTGTGLVLQDNGGNNQALSASGSFTFSTAVASGAAYSVTVFTQPTGQSCTVSNGSGTASANVSNVQVTCAATTYTIGGTVSGLTGTGLVLQDNGGNNKAVSASGSFTFSTAVASGAAYSVTVLTQPTGQSCTVTNGSGTASANVTNVQVICSSAYYSIGGTVTGLTGTGLVLMLNNSLNELGVNVDGSFTFSGAVSSGAAYSVTVLTQPTAETCTITNGSGTANTNVTNIQVACSLITYTIGGTVSGLTGTGLILQDNGGNNLSMSANGTFVFSNSVAGGAAYTVTVLTEPTSQVCTVTNGMGRANTNVGNILVACSAAYYTIGGTISGLTGTGLVLQNNLNSLAVSANGSFNFSVANGAPYYISIQTQPTGQVCTVTNGSGTASANVTNVQVACLNLYSISGDVSGLTGTGLVLQNNGGNTLAISANGVFTLPNGVASGSTYNITVLTQPTGQSCTVTGGNGTASANVGNILVACTAVYYTIGGTVSGPLLLQGLVLQDNGGNNLPLNSTGSFTFSISVPGRAAYSVTILTQPMGLSCAVSNGSGTATANVTSVQVACVGQWIWTGGSNTGSQHGVYGTLGTATSTNVPGGRYEAVSWSDVYGNPWLFGGTGIDSTGTVGSLNDLWEFDFSLGSNGEWKWMGGSTTVGSNGGRSGIYGPVGTATSTNIPGGRQDAVSWTDSSGKFWLFGGYGYDSTGTLGWLNDPWEFDPSLGSNGEWKWMGGSTTVNQSGVYGTQGTAAFTNIPGGRQNAVSWTDSNDNLWLFGGVGYDSTRTQGPLNDLWKFDPKPGSNGEWTWMGGSSTGNQIGVYGTLVTTASTNIPGGRQNAVSWTDSSGKFWLFGGYGNDSTGTVRSLNDLWKFDPSLGSNGEWTWMGGSSTGNQSGVYGTLGTAASTNIPGARYEAVSWSDGSGNFWLFGGAGYDSTGTLGSLNDLWKFDPSLGSNGEWTWMGGSSTGNQSGVYGTLGTAASTNVPGARYGAVSWNGLLFGGYGYLNDLWEYSGLW